MRFSGAEEPEAQMELEPELANRLFQAVLCIRNDCFRNMIESSCSRPMNKGKIRKMSGSVPDPKLIITDPDPCIKYQEFQILILESKI